MGSLRNIALGVAGVGIVAFSGCDNGDAGQIEDTEVSAAGGGSGNEVVNKAGAAGSDVNTVTCKGPIELAIEVSEVASKVKNVFLNGEGGFVKGIDYPFVSILESPEGKQRADCKKSETTSGFPPGGLTQINCRLFPVSAQNFDTYAEITTFVPFDKSAYTLDFSHFGDSGLVDKKVWHNFNTSNGQYVEVSTNSKGESKTEDICKKDTSDVTNFIVKTAETFGEFTK